MDKLKESKIVKQLFENGKSNIFIIIGFLGILFLSLNTSSKENTPEVLDETADTLEEYRTELEIDLKNILSKVNGAGEVEVMITFESSWQTIYVKQEKSLDDTQVKTHQATSEEIQKSTFEDTYVLVQDGSEETGLVEMKLQPKIQGVIIVSKGAEDISVISNLTNAAKVALDVASNRICVIKMQ